MSNNLRLIQRAAYPFVGSGAFNDDHSWSMEVRGSDDLPDRIQNLLDEFSRVSGGYPDSAASLTFSALDRIYLDMGFLLQRVVTTWATLQGMNPEDMDVDFALSINYTSIIETASYRSEDISSQLREAMISWLPINGPLRFRPAEVLTDEEIAKVVEILDELAEES